MNCLVNKFVYLLTTSGILNRRSGSLKITISLDGSTHNLALPGGVEVDWLPAKIGISQSIKEKFHWLIEFN